MGKQFVSATAFAEAVIAVGSRDYGKIGEKLGVTKPHV